MYNPTIYTKVMPVDKNGGQNRNVGCQDFGRLPGLWCHGWDPKMMVFRILEEHLQEPNHLRNQTNRQAVFEMLVGFQG